MDNLDDDPAFRVNRDGKMLALPVPCGQNPEIPLRMIRIRGGEERAAEPAFHFLIRYAELTFQRLLRQLPCLFLGHITLPGQADRELRRAEPGVTEELVMSGAILQRQ